jgi:DNA-binding transcriptional regulator PaaX
MNDTSPAWLLLITNLPGQNQTLRMRVWRALKAAGAGLLRDGVYVLPQTAVFRKVFEEQALVIRAVAGGAHILTFESDSIEQRKALIELFDRARLPRTPYSP